MDAGTAAAIEKIKRNKDAAEQLMRSGDGQRLMALLTRDGGAALERATRSAARGDTAALSGMLQDLMRDPGAAAAMERISDAAKRKG